MQGRLFQLWQCVRDQTEQIVKIGPPPPPYTYLHTTAVSATDEDFILSLTTTFCQLAACSTCNRKRSQERNITHQFDASGSCYNFWLDLPQICPPWNVALRLCWIRASDVGGKDSIDIPRVKSSFRNSITLVYRLIRSYKSTVNLSSNASICGFIAVFFANWSSFFFIWWLTPYRNP